MKFETLYHDILQSVCPSKKYLPWPREYRPKTTTQNDLKMAAVIATKTAKDVYQAEPVEQVAQKSSATPVCAYNEWDLLEVDSVSET